MMFYKRHPMFAMNSSLNTLVTPPQTPTVFSDLVVMRMGKRGQYINMRTGDASLVDRVVAK